MSRRAPITFLAVLGLALAACSGAASPTAQPAGSNPPQPVQTAGAVGGGGGGGAGAVGYDCAALITPAELDTASGLKGGTVTTRHRGDQASAGEVMGVTECGIANDSVDTWFGGVSVFTGVDAMNNFDAAWDLAKTQGATSLDGVGTEAILWTDQGTVGAMARGSNGVGVSVTIAWDDLSTSEAAVKAAAKQILATVLPRR
jgi:hypothetical protein